MKLLLIGFSKQNADVLQMLIERLYPEYELVIIERYFGGSLRLQLPKLERLPTDTMLIINLDGVGIVNFAASHIDELKGFTQGLATMLVARHSLDEWQSALPKEVGVWISTPYSRESMTTALSDLHATHTKLLTHPRNSVVSTHGQVFKENEAPIALSNPDLSYNSQEEESQFLHKLLSECFAIPKLVLLHNILDVRVSNTPLKVKIGNQTFYACPKHQVAYVNDIGRLMDYCDMLYGLELSADAVIVEPMEKVDFGKLSPIFHKKGYRKYTLSSLLWQICWRLLPNEVNVPDHSLKLKMRYMPNFLQMKKIPEYIRPLVASCLSTPRSVDELIVLLRGDENMKKQINHLVLVAILSGVADTGVLRQSHKKQAVSDVKKEDNEGIKTAKKTGFLSRFLSKLSF